MQPIAAPLLQWFDANKRLLLPAGAFCVPYLGQRDHAPTDPCGSGHPYYERFIAALPDPAALAACEPDALRKLWQAGLLQPRQQYAEGCPHRLASSTAGDPPADYDALRSLPGIGDYTAGAVASIAFGIPVPAVDGNVLRVFARLVQRRRGRHGPGNEESLYRAGAGPDAQATPGLQRGPDGAGALVCIPGTPPTVRNARWPICAGAMRLDGRTSCL